MDLFLGSRELTLSGAPKLASLRFAEKQAAGVMGASHHLRNEGATKIGVVEPKSRGKTSKMDGENNGKPY